MTIEERVVILERGLIDLNAGAFWGRLKSNFWRTFAVVMSLMFVALFAALYLHSAGLISLSSSSPSSGMLPNSLKPAGDFRDLLTILVPMFAAGIAFVVSAAGMRRLQSYDDELARARQERRDDEKSMRKETVDSATLLRAEVTTNAEKLRQDFKEERDTFKVQIKDQTDKVLDEKVIKLNDDVALLKTTAETAIRQTAADVLTSVQNIATRLDADFGFLKGKVFLASSGAKSTISVGALHNELSQLLQSTDSGDRQKAVLLLNTALALPERMSGQSDDWFNLSAQLGKSDMELEAFNVCVTALERFADSEDASYSPNQDLLAHAIQFASALGKWPECKSLIEQAEKIGRARWTWRLFVFMGDHFENRGDESAFLELNKVFAEVLPYSEQPYAQLASYWYKRGQVDKALQAIDSGMSKVGVRGERLLTRKSEILLDLARYAEVIAATSDALAATATAQPGGAQWAIMNHRAYAFDALLWQIVGSINTQNPIMSLTAKQKEDALGLARSALASYSAASELRGASLTTKAQAISRTRLIRYACEVLGVDLGNDPKDSSTLVKSVKKSLSSAAAQNLVMQLTDQLKGMDLEGWTAIQDALVEQLVSDFNDSARHLLSAGMLAAAVDSPSAGDYLRLLAKLIEPAISD